MSQDMAELIRQKLDDLAVDPYASHSNATKLKKYSGYRLRVGDWRVIYEVDGDQLIILVLKIGPRGGIYK